MKRHEQDILYAKSMISPKMIEDFDKKGWIKINLGLDSDFVNLVLRDLKKARKYAISKNYPAKRVYYDHLLDFNIASIELPYNYKICPESVKEFFKVARIGALVNYLMGWKSTINTLSRLFTMGHYNYRGQWHRDYLINSNENQNNSRNRQRVQAGIYFQHQEGFRILKKEFDRSGEKSIFNSDDNGQLEKNISTLPLPINLAQHFYDVVKAEPGTIILFDPYIYHQGSCNGERLDFHMRFDNATKIKQKKVRNSFQDFDVLTYLESNFDMSNLKTVNIPKEHIFQTRQNLKKRLINTTNYHFPIYNLYLYLRNKQKFSALPKFFTADLLSNNLFQPR